MDKLTFNNDVERDLWIQHFSFLMETKNISHAHAGDEADDMIREYRKRLPDAPDPFTN